MCDSDKCKPAGAEGVDQPEAQTLNLLTGENVTRRPEEDWILDFVPTVGGCECKEFIRRRIAHMYALYYDRCEGCRSYLRKLHEYVIHQGIVPDLIPISNNCCVRLWRIHLAENIRKDFDKRLSLGKECDECKLRIRVVFQWISSTYDENLRTTNILEEKSVQEEEDWILDFVPTVGGCECKEYIRRRIAHMYALYYDRCEGCRFHLRSLHEYVIHQGELSKVVPKSINCCKRLWRTYLSGNIRQDYAKKISSGKDCAECEIRISVVLQWISSTYNENLRTTSLLEEKLVQEEEDWILDFVPTVGGCKCKEYIRRRIAHMYALYYDRCEGCRFHLRSLHEYVIHQGELSKVVPKSINCCKRLWRTYLSGNIRQDYAKKISSGKDCVECEIRISVVLQWISSTYNENLRTTSLLEEKLVQEEEDWILDFVPTVGGCKCKEYIRRRIAHMYALYYDRCEGCRFHLRSLHEYVIHQGELSKVVPKSINCCKRLWRSYLAGNIRKDFAMRISSGKECEECELRIRIVLQWID